MALVKFIQGSLAQYNGLEVKDENTLYFITDAQKIYKGDKLFSGGVFTAVPSFPESGEINTLYVNTTDGSVKYWNGASYQEVVKPTATTINGSGDNLHFPTTKAIVDYVTTQIQDMDMSAVTDRLDTIEGQIKVINGEGEGSIKKALVDAKAYTDEKVATKADTEHVHETADITGLDAALAGKADKADTLAGYGITDAYTKTETYAKGEVDSAIATAIANAPHLKRQIVEELPDPSGADANTIYMVGTGEGSETSSYKEYMLINGKFELIGDSKVDLTDYATKSYVDSAKSEAISTAGSNADSKIAAKVGAIDGTVKDYVDTAKSDAIGQITTQINLLDSPDAAVEGQYVSSVVQNDGIITVQRVELPVKSVTEGSKNGTIAVNGSDVKVHGLGSAAYVGTETFATAEQGTKADTALQQSDITTGSTNGTISVKGSNVAIAGLKSAAYSETSAFATAAQGTKADEAWNALTWGSLE